MFPIPISNSRFRDFAVSRVREFFRNFAIPQFRDSVNSRFRNSVISRFHDFAIPRFRVSGLRDSAISRFRYFAIPEFRDFAIPRFHLVSAEALSREHPRCSIEAHRQCSAAFATSSPPQLAEPPYAQRGVPFGPRAHPFE